MRVGSAGSLGAKFLDGKRNHCPGLPEEGRKKSWWVVQETKAEPKRLTCVLCMEKHSARAAPNEQPTAQLPPNEPVPGQGCAAGQFLLDKNPSHLRQAAATDMEGAGKPIPFSACSCFKNPGISGMKPGKNRLPAFDFWQLPSIQCQPALPSLGI